MALSRTETNIADGVAIGSLVTGTMAMGLAMLGNPSLQTNFAALGTSSFALGGAPVYCTIKRVRKSWSGKRTAPWKKPSRPRRRTSWTK